MKSLLSLLLLVLLNVHFLSAQDSKAQGVLDKLSSKMKGLKSFYIEFNASIKNSETGTNENETGKGWVKGDKYFANYNDNTIISNGLTTWSIVKEDKSVYEADSDDSEESLNPKKLMTIWENDFKNKYTKEGKLNNELVHVINLTPKQLDKSDYSSIVLYISKSKNELKKVIMKLKDNTTMTFSLTKLTVNLAIDDTKFIFDKKKYPGFSVIKD